MSRRWTNVCLLLARPDGSTDNKRIIESQAPSHTMEDKLDTILQRLDGLTQGMGAIKTDVASVKSDMEKMQLFF